YSMSFINTIFPYTTLFRSTIAGGKLTGYRKMAETVVDKVVKILKENDDIIFSKSKTINLPISGGHIGGSKNLDNYLDKSSQKLIELGLTKNEALELAKM